MDIHKVAALAQVFSFVTGAYCAYGTYVSLHPPTAGGSPPATFGPTALYISFGAFSTCLLVVGVTFLVDRFHRHPDHAEGKKVPEIQAQRQAKLKIDSAYYGLGNANDIDVTETLQNMPRNALAVWVGNNLIPGLADPAPNQAKQLTVHYSFGAEQRSAPCVVPEHRQLVLPRDLDWARELGIAYEQQRLARVDELDNELRRERANTSMLENNNREGREEIRKLKEFIGQVTIPSTQYPIFTLQKCWYEPVKPDVSDVYYKDKIRFVITSSYNDTISVWAPLWKSSEVNYQPPLAAFLQLEGPKGWRADDWEKDAHECITLKGGRSFKGWIGLSPPFGEGLELRVNRRTTGQLTFPIKVEGKLRQESVPI
jgi:hypothetical protein